MTEIETDVPIPSKHHIPKLPWDDLDIGQSFFVPFDGDDPKKIVNRLNAQQVYYKKRRNKLFTRRALPTGIRIWRVE